MKLYGIKNCDSVKKAVSLLDSKGVSYEFIDVKKAPPSEKQISKWIDEKGLDVVINKRGMMWKKLPQERRDNLDKNKAIQLALEIPTIIKRPVIEYKGSVLIGFEETQKNFS